MPSGPEQNKQANDDAQAQTIDFGSETADGSASIESSPDITRVLSARSLKTTQVVPGSNIGKYVVRSQLGSGGMGTVYLAFDPLIEREIALKMLSSEQSGSDLAVQRFIQEARSIGKLTHPNVVAIYDIDRWSDQYFIVMELISGGSLSQTVRRDGPLDWKEACRLIMQAAEGLNAAHQANLIHRDVKPENLMVTSEGLCKVVDFGLCKAAAVEQDSEAAITHANNILGTPQYMSPEQFQGKELDARADLYSLGGTLFYLLTGKYPFHEAKGILQMMTAHINEPVGPASRWNPLVPVECDQIIAKAMAKAPDDRFPTAASMAASLRNLLTREQSTESIDDFLPSIDPEPLAEVLVVEPSKMQATVLSGSIRKNGIRSVRIASSMDEGMRSIVESKPQAVITSLQFNDGTGLDFIRRLRQDPSMAAVSVILNSSDSSIEELIEASPKGNAILSPKKTKPEDLLRMVHGTSPFFCESLAAGDRWLEAQPRLVVLTETGELSEQLSGMIRELQILDVVVDSVAGLATLTAHAGPELRLVVRHGAGATSLLAKLAVQFSSDPSLTAVVQEAENRLRLRTVWFRGMLALANTPLDSARLRLLFESCLS
ncbi:MAG: protein kinase domain-containing protein [Planctomycetota bacterium]|jgi:serine/threonine protein kinase